MSAVTAGVFERVRNHFRTPLYRNGYALMLSTGLTSSLGFVFWLVAARLYPVDVVGLNSAALASLIFLAGAAQFSLSNVLIRFIPSAGKGAPALILRAMVLTFLAGFLAGLAFLAGVDRLAPTLGFLRGNVLSVISFSLATAMWGVFVLQEGVLTGLRLAAWIPTRNAFFAMGKIVLLFVFANSLPHYGLLASWMIPAVLTLLPTALLIRRHVLGPRSLHPALESTSKSQILSYALGDYAGSLFWLATTMLVPVMVTEVAGTVATAHFYLAWTIAYTSYLVAPSMGSSLIVEAVLDPASLAAYSKRAIAQTARLVLPLVALLVIFGPHILALLGGAYAAEGSTLLQLISLSAVPNIVTALYTSIARVQRNIRAIVGILAAQCVCVLALSYALLTVAGITGVGLAWLISQCAIAGVLVTFRNRLFVLPPEPAHSG